MSSMLSIRNRFMGPYKYRPQTGHLDIRLLTLFPGKWDSPIKCKLHHTSLEQLPKYDALSYVWGNATKTSTILLDHHVFNVTRNLEVALRAVRDEYKNRVLWIDAICIDQKNIPERNRQVQIMWRIYESAQIVLAWLGEDADNSEQAMALLSEVGAMMRRLQEDEDTALNLPESLNIETSTALWRLLQRPYWSRVWIIQEQHFSGDYQERDQDRCSMGCGRQWISRFHLTGAFIFLQVWGKSMSGTAMNFDSPSTDAVYQTMGQDRLRTFDESPALQMFEQIRFARYLQENGSASSQLSTMMHKTRHFKATEPKDMVFALLGLLRDKNLGFPIDYSKPIEYTLKEVVQFTIIEDQTLLILQGNRNENESDGPFWLPDPRYYLRSTKPWDRWHLYKASKDLLAEKPRFDGDDRRMLVRGVVIGTVSTQIGPFGQTQALLLKDADLAGLPYATLKEYSKKLSADKREDFWRTLVLNQETVIDTMKFPAPDALAHMYEVLINDAPIPEDFEPDMREQGNTFGYRYLYTYRFANNLSMCAGQRCFLETITGYMGMGPYCTAPGDLVVVLLGGSFPFVLRPKGEYYILIGDAYVHGAMNGEFINLDECGNVLNAREFGLC